MKYDVQLDLMESTGIFYHRKTAQCILEKTNHFFTSNYKPSILIVGENDMLISRLLARQYPLHILTRQRNDLANTNIHLIYEDIHPESRIIPVTIDTFDLSEYDLIIFLFTDFKLFKEIFDKSNSKFIFFPDYTSMSQKCTKDELTKAIKSFLVIRHGSFSLQIVDCQNYINNLVISNI